MTNNVKVSLRLAKKVIPPTLCSPTASIANSTTIGAGCTYDMGQNFSCTLYCSTGVIYINPIVTATTANSFVLNEGKSIDLKVENILSLVADTTTAKFQGFVWEG